jgi:hypothetical protein
MKGAHPPPATQSRPSAARNEPDHDAVETLVAVLDLADTPDGRFEDTHYVAKLMHGASALLAARLHNPDAAAAIAERLVATRRFVPAACMLLEDGGSLFFAAPQALSLVLAASGATHEPALDYRANRLVLGLFGAALANRGDPVVQPLLAMCLKALADGPASKRVSAVAAQQPGLLKVVEALYAAPGLRAAGASILVGLLRVPEGCVWCGQHYAALDLLTVGTPLHDRLEAKALRGVNSQTRRS